MICVTSSRFLDAADRDARVVPAFHAEGAQMAKSASETGVAMPQPSR
jgi:hypothetical protein